MKLSEALKAIRSVNLDEIETELKDAQKILEGRKAEAKDMAAKHIAPALEEVKLLKRLLTQRKVAAGLPVRKRKKQRGNQ